MKTRQDNDVTQRMGLVYVENDIELLRHIGSGVVFEETKHHNDETNHTGGSTPNKNWIVITNKIVSSLWKLDKTMTWSII